MPRGFLVELRKTPCTDIVIRTPTRRGAAWLPNRAKCACPSLARQV